MEIIRFGTPGSTPPLLFVHGSYCGAWIWERFFLAYFAKAGYYGAAISLRGHGKSPDAAQIDTYGIPEFLEDIDEGVRLFDKKPILIGHSLGGYLVQRYALTHDDVPGLMLLSSPSLAGLASSSQHILMNNPMLAIQLGLLMSFGPTFADAEVIGGALFLKGVPRAEKEQMSVLLQTESKRISAEAFWPCWEKPVKIPPTFVLGGDCDAFVPLSDCQQEADFWKGELKIMPNVPHGVMLDTCWQKVAGEMKTWLEKTFG